MQGRKELEERIVLVVSHVGMRPVDSADGELSGDGDHSVEMEHVV